MNTDFDFFQTRRANFKFKKVVAKKTLKDRAGKHWEDFPHVLKAVLFSQAMMVTALTITFLLFSTAYFKALGDMPIYESNDYKASQRMVQVLASEVAKAPSRIPHETLDAVMNDAEVKKAMAAAFLKQADKPNKPILLETEQTP